VLCSSVVTVRSAVFCSVRYVRYIVFCACVLFVRAFCSCFVHRALSLTLARSYRSFFVCSSPQMNHVYCVISPVPPEELPSDLAPPSADSGASCSSSTESDTPTPPGLMDWKKVYKAEPGQSFYKYAVLRDSLSLFSLELSLSLLERLSGWA
jgi:hypothetical protein